MLVFCDEDSTHPRSATLTPVLIRVLIRHFPALLNAWLIVRQEKGSLCPATLQRHPSYVSALVSARCMQERFALTKERGCNASCCASATCSYRMSYGRLPVAPALLQPRTACSYEVAAPEQLASNSLTIATIPYRRILCYRASIAWWL
jgi:hypothetical protein